MKPPFLLPDFTRVIWHSAEGRDVWAPRIQRITAAWAQIERVAVIERLRDACLTFCDPRSLPEFAILAARSNLMVLPLAATALASQYSSTSAPLIDGRPWHYRVVLVRPDKMDDWIDAWGAGGKATDNCAIGRLLGYPRCCTAFFQRVWVRDSGVDTTWEMACGTSSTTSRVWDNGAELRVPAGVGYPEANILLRWLGVRLVPHLPCAFNCGATADRGQMYAAVGRKIGFAEEVDWMYEMLQWPVEWSALHGIAEVRTPVCTVSTRTTATVDMHVVQRDGFKYPEEGAHGLRFPFRIVKGRVTAKPSFARSVQSTHELNGFGSKEAMDTAHDVLLRALPVPCAGQSVLDLGCGTGQLLARCQVGGWDRVMGVEVDNARAGAAVVPVKRGSLFDTTLWEGRWSVIVFMPGRLLEDGITEEERNAVRQALRDRADTVVVYAYGDWVERYGGLGPLVAEAGLADGTITAMVTGPSVEAARLVFASHAEEGTDVESEKASDERVGIE